MRLPIALQTEPLVDAIFEVRTRQSANLPELLPGLIADTFDRLPQLQRLPHSEIPQQIRSSDPNLMFTPLIRIEGADLLVMIGDRNFTISPKLPYPGWSVFREKIFQILDRVVKSGVLTPVDRFSLKYINIIERPSLTQQFQSLNLSLSIGNTVVRDHAFTVQVQESDGETMHLVTVMTGASGQKYDGSVLNGVVVDIDSIMACDFASISDFRQALGEPLEVLKTANKKRFFECLSSAALKQLGPIYD